MNDAATAERSLVLEREVPHPPEKVWRALTQSAIIEEWLMKTNFEPTVGHRFSFRSAPQPHWNGIVEGEVLKADPNKLLSYTWNTFAGTDLKTVITCTLTPTENGTLIRVEQSGFRPEDENAYQGASKGWSRLIGNLERVLAALS